MVVDHNLVTGRKPDDIPVFVRAGAVLALLPDDVDSLSPYGRELPDRRDVLAFPAGPGGPAGWKVAVPGARPGINPGNQDQVT